MRDRLSALSILLVALLLVAGVAWAGPSWVDDLTARVDALEERVAALEATSTTTTTTLPPTTTTAPSATTTSTSTTTTTVPPTTTTSTTTTAPQGVVFVAGHEEGNFSDWDGVWNSGTYNASVDCGFAHTGSCSARAEVGSSGGIRLTWQGRNIAGQSDPENLPTDAVYSAWFYIPQVHAVSWLNIFQFKYRYEGGGTRPMHYVVLNDAGSEYSIQLHSQVTADGTFTGSARQVASTPVRFPVGEWVKVTTRYVWDRTGNGTVTTWLNGTLLWDVDGLYTEGDWAFGHWGREWAVNNYGAGISPTPFTIWIDDAEVSR